MAFDYLIKVIPPVIVGTLAMGILVEMGWIRRMAFLTAPLINHTHLREEIGISFLTSFGSSTAGNAMLAKLYDDRHMDRKETIIATMVNSFPSSIVLSRDLLPVVIILLGKTGLIYLGIVIFIGFVKTMLALIAARILLRPGTPVKADAQIDIDIKNVSFREACKNALKKSRRSLIKIIVTMTIVSIIVFQLMGTGIFDRAAAIMQDSFIISYVPPEGLPIIAGWFAGNIAAYTIAGNLLETHMLSPKDIILALLIGRVLASITRIKTMLPYYVGIFNPNLGIRIMFVSLAMQNAIMIAIAGFMVLFL